LFSNKFLNGHQTSINDVAWAPLMGRSFHMIASCSKETIAVWKVTVRDIFNSEQAFFKEPKIEQLFKIDSLLGQVSRLSWNLLGTCLASSGDDGCVRIWKKNISKSFTQIACLQSK
jgi:nucleoporin SEH1